MLIFHKSFRKAIGAFWAIRSERKAQQERQKAEINEIEALNQTVKALFASHDELNALLLGVKTGIKSKNLNLPVILRNQILFNLQEIFYNLREENRLSGHTSAVNSVAFSPNGKFLASGSDDRTVKLWNVADGRELFTLQGHSDRVNCVVFSPNGTFLASGSSTLVR